MNRKMIVIIVPLIALMLMSCRFSMNVNGRRLTGSGNLKTETRQVSGVERVSMQDYGHLTVVQGSEESLTVEADDNLLQHIQTRMEGSELVLEIEDGYTVDADDVTIRYTLTVKDLTRISLAGAGSVTAGSLKVTDLALDVAGSGNVDISDLQAEDLRASSSGSGNFEIKGKVTTQDISIAGAGNYLAGDLQSAETDVTINGAGNVTVWASDRLNVRVAGMGNVSYYGSPSVSQTITGGGGVKNLGEK